MKKWIVLLLSLIVALSLCACDSGDSSYSYNSEAEEDELTNDEIESIVSSAIYREINSKYDAADAGSCRYKINKTEEEKDGYIYVYGSVTLYDKYGKLTGGWNDGSGSPYRDFTVKINAETKRASSCDIK